MSHHSVPGNTNQGRFAYTGQIYIPQLELYYYKARMYAPKLGRFLQTDPVGYEDQMNLYAYVHNDPLNYIDPTGEAAVCAIPGVMQACAAGAVAVGVGVRRVGVWGARKVASAIFGMTNESADNENTPDFEDVEGNKAPSTGVPGSTVRGGTGSRTYGEDGYPLTDREFGHPDEAGCGSEEHCHDWGRPEGGGRPTHEDRGNPRPPKPGDPPSPRGPNVPPPEAKLRWNY